MTNTANDALVANLRQKIKLSVIVTTDQHSAKKIISFSAILGSAALVQNLIELMLFRYFGQIRT